MRGNMMNIEIIRKKNSHQIIAKVNDDYVLISESGPEVSSAVSYPETLAFLCDSDGNVSSWTEVAGGSMMQISDVLVEISQYGINKKGAF